MEESVPLSQLSPGQRGTIVRVGGEPDERLRYLEMGFVNGETIHVVRLAPLGDPVEFQVKGYRLSLRAVDAAKILVRPNGENDGG